MAPRPASPADSWAGLLAVVDAPQLLQDIADASGAMIFAKDLEGRFILVNRLGCEMAGLPLERMLGRTDEEIFGTEAARLYVEHDRRVLESGTPIEFEEQVVRGGQRINFLCVKFPLRDPRGRIYGVCGISTDITERKRVEQQMLDARKIAEQSRVQLEAVLSSMAEGLVACDAQGRLLYWNAAALRLHGFDNLDDAQRPLDALAEDFELRDETGRAVPLEHWPLSRALRGETFAGQELHLHRRSTALDLTVSYSGAPVRDPQGRLRLALVTIHDVTAQKRAEATMREHERRLQLILDHAAVAIAEIDPQGRLQTVNREGAQILGYDERDLLSRNVLEIIDEQDRAAIAEAIARLLNGETESVLLEARYLHRDGRRIWGQTTGTVIRDEAGRIVRLLGTVVDITARKQADDDLRALTATLEHRVAERSAVAEQRAEQLRRLAVELSQAEQRERRRIAHTLHDHLQQILVAVKMRLSSGAKHDVGPMLDEAICASRSLAVQLSPPVLSDRGLVAALRWLARQMEQDHGLTVTLNLADERQEIEPDLRHFLFQAVRELLFNVIKHSGQNRAALSLRYERPDLLHIEVANQGKGCDAERLLRSAADEGAFGLFSIQQRLAHLGGDLQVLSTPAPGSGCRVTMQLPLSAATGVDAESPPEADQMPVLRVLLADDHRIVREGLRELLNEAGGMKVVAEAANGEEAVRRAAELRPDVAVLDVSMDKMSGIEAARRIRQHCPVIRIIGLSMHDSPDVAAAMLQAGAQAFIPKDGPAEQLITAIRGVGAKSL